MSAMSSPVVVHRWQWPALVGVFYVVAGALNVRPLLAGARPGIAGELASVGYCVAWLVLAFGAGRLKRCRLLRGMAGFWAVVIACAALCTTFVRLDARSGVAASGWMVTALLVVAAAPLYGLAGTLAREPLTVLTAVTVGAGVLVLGLAAAARKLAPATS